MNSHRHSLMKRRVGAALVAAMACAGLGTAWASPASAVTDVSVSIATAYGANKVTSELSIYDTVAVITRTPQIEGTPDDAATRNATRPTLTCTVGLGTASASTLTSTGEYVSHDGILNMAFLFANAVPATVDSCTLTTSTFIKKSGDTVYPLSQAGRTALWGDPAKTLSKAQNRLKSVAPQVRSVFNGKWGDDFTARIARAVKNYKLVEVARRLDASSTSSKTMYVLRWPGHATNWIHICQRLADGRLTCMRYNPVTNKSTFWIDTTSTNYYTTSLTQGASS